MQTKSFLTAVANKVETSYKVKEVFSTPIRVIPITPETSALLNAKITISTDFNERRKIPAINKEQVKFRKLIELQKLEADKAFIKEAINVKVITFDKELEGIAKLQKAVAEMDDKGNYVRNEKGMIPSSKNLKMTSFEAIAEEELFKTLKFSTDKKTLTLKGLSIKVVDCYVETFYEDSLDAYFPKQKVFMVTNLIDQSPKTVADLDKEIAALQQYIASI